MFGGWRGVHTTQGLTDDWSFTQRDPWVSTPHRQLLFFKKINMTQWLCSYFVWKKEKIGKKERKNVEEMLVEKTRVKPFVCSVKRPGGPCGYDVSNGRSIIVLTFCPHPAPQIDGWWKWIWICTWIKEETRLKFAPYLAEQWEGKNVVKALNGPFMSIFIMTTGFLCTLCTHVHALGFFWQVYLNSWGLLHFGAENKNTAKDLDSRGNGIWMNLVGKLIFWEEGQFKHFRRDVVSESRCKVICYSVCHAKCTFGWHTEVSP